MNSETEAPQLFSCGCLRASAMVVVRGCKFLDALGVNAVWFQARPIVKLQHLLRMRGEDASSTQRLFPP